MKKLLLALIVCTLAMFGCPPIDSGMYCERMFDQEICIDGTYPQACVSYDTTMCGYKVRGQYFYCDRCELDNMDCDDAARDAVNFCYGSRRMEELDSGEVEDFVYRLEELKEMIQ